MKYGYMFCKKALIPAMRTRPINFGDPTQSYAVKNLYREMGINEEDIIPVPRYDAAAYDGEECICVMNGASNYEELAYNSRFMPPSHKIHSIIMGLHIHRKIPEDELAFYKTCGGVGCRDIYTVNYLRSLGVNAYLTGCLTMTLPRRTKEQEKNADTIYFVDVPESLYPYIPEEIKSKAVKLNNVMRFQNTGNSDRMSVKATFEYHRQAEERIALLRDTAKLVVTSKLHIGTPCAAMGIPVVMAKSYFGDRFGFIDRFLPLYTPERYSEINWEPEPVDFEYEKTKIKNVFFSAVRAVSSRLELNKMWAQKKPIYNISYETATKFAVQGLQNVLEKNFRYAVWGIVLSAAYYLEEAIREEYPEAKLMNGIDIASKNDFCGVPTIRPEQIGTLEKDVIVIVAAPSAQESALELLRNTSRKFILLHGTKTQCYNF